MRCASVASMKRLLKNKKRKPLRGTPHTSSKIGQLYDKFKANKAEPIQITNFKPNILKATLNQLIDFYGLDIRQTQRCNKRLGLTAEYTLVGEWFGKVYVDYIAEKMEKS